MAREALSRLNDGDIADEIIEEFRRRDDELLRLQSQFGATEAYQRLRDKFDLSDDALV